MAPQRAAPFVDRKSELQGLAEQFDRPGGRLVVVLGRRRLGKSEILARFCKGRRAAFLFCPEAEAPMVFRRLEAELAAAFGLRVPAAEDPPSVDSFVGLLTRCLRSGPRPIVVLDEFQNLAAADPSVVSLLQREWDWRLKDAGGMLILCGSAVGMMERLVLSSKSPLFGRKTGQLRLGPLPFWSTGRLLPERALIPRLLRYTIGGGVPHYLKLLYPYSSLEAALRAVVFAKGGALHEELPAAIYAETREPERYLSILEQMAAGAARLGDIADRTGIAATSLPPYMDTLTDKLRIVERRTVITDGRAWNKKSLYRISDPFFRFWFACVAPRRSALTQGRVEPVLAEALARLPTLAGPVLEDIIRDALFASYGTSWGALPVRYDRIGNWWNRSGDEIDLVGMGPDRATLAAEVKLGLRPVDAASILRLTEKIELLPLAGPIEQAVVTAGTFTDAARRQAEAMAVRLVDGEALEAVFARLARRVPRPNIRKRPGQS